MTQHTPSPWLIAENDNSFIYSLNDDGTNRFHFSIQTGYVQQLRDKSIRTSPEEIAANAALICASPILYDYAVNQAKKGCKEAKLMLDSLGLRKKSQIGRSAIAKAKQLTNNNQ